MHEKQFVVHEVVLVCTSIIDKLLYFTLENVVTLCADKTPKVLYINKKGQKTRGKRDIENQYEDETETQKMSDEQPENISQDQTENTSQENLESEKLSEETDETPILDDETYSPIADKESNKLNFESQTKRMFYFLAGLNSESVDSPNRIVKLLKKSASIARSVCDPMFFKPRFIDESLRAFLFLLKEQGTERFKDVDVEDFTALMDTLESCGEAATPFKFVGNSCPLQFSVSFEL